MPKPFGFEYNTARTLKKIANERDRETRSDRTHEHDVSNFLNIQGRVYVVILADTIDAATGSSYPFVMSSGTGQVLYRLPDPAEKFSQDPDNTITSDGLDAYLDKNSDPLYKRVWNPSTTASAPADVPLLATQDVWGDLYLISPGGGSSNPQADILYYSLTIGIYGFSTTGISAKLNTTYRVGWPGTQAVVGDETAVGIQYQPYESRPDTNGNFKVTKTGLYRLTLSGHAVFTPKSTSQYPTFAIEVYNKLASGGSNTNYKDPLNGLPATYVLTAYLDDLAATPSPISGNIALPISHTYLCNLTINDVISFRLSLTDVNSPFTQVEYKLNATYCPIISFEYIGPTFLGSTLLTTTTTTTT